MTLAAVLGFLAVAGVAAYVQTVTGFAFGLVTMGLVGLSGLMPLPVAAVLVGLLTLVNAAQMLTRGWRHVARRQLLLVLASSIPGLVLGYLALHRLSEAGSLWLRVVLGTLIVVASLQLVLERSRRVSVSGGGTFLGVGLLSGIMTGLFSTGGPPLVYHFHRQPWPMPTVRETLVACFGIAQVFRFAVVLASGDLPGPDYWPAALAAVPVVMGFTWLGRNRPPPLPPVVLRLVVFALLMLSGVALAAPALQRI